MSTRNSSSGRKKLWLRDMWARLEERSEEGWVQKRQVVAAARRGADASLASRRVVRAASVGAVASWTRKGMVRGFGGWAG